MTGSGAGDDRGGATGASLSSGVIQEGRALLVPDVYGMVSFSALAVYFHKYGAALLDRAHDYEFDVNVPLAELREERSRLRAALEELLGVAERIRGGDSKLDPEQWYATRDYARVVLKGTDA